eukprot:s758_g31.t1
MHEALTRVDYEDASVALEASNGFPLVGWMKCSGVFASNLRPPSLHVDALDAMAASFSARTMASVKPSGDDKLDAEVWDATMTEVSGGTLEGPYEVADLTAGHIVSPRFGIRQGLKTRPIDNLSASGLNSTVGLPERLQVDTIDEIATVVKHCMQTHGSQCKLVGRTYDLKKAYRQLGVSEEHYRRNKLQHILMGNWYLKAALLAATLPLVWKTEQEAGEVLDSISSFGTRVIFEIEETTAQTIQVTGLIVKAALWSLGLMVMWFVGRMVSNRLNRAYHGNTMPAKLLEMKADGQTSWEVTGSKGQHVVWIRLTPPHQSACACRAFIGSGTCGHIDAAVDQAKSMGLAPERAVMFDEGSVAQAKGAALLRAMGGERPPKAIQDALGSSHPNETRAPAVGVDAVQGVGASTTCQVQYLKDDATFPVFAELVKGLAAGSTVHLRAYSCDQPDTVDSLLCAVSRGIKVAVLMDQTQASGKTKNQLQLAKQLQVSGVKVRMTRGKSIAEAYTNDRRSTKVGSGLQGLHHAKSVLICGGEVNHLIVTSCNWTTSSRANREVGVLVSTKETSGLIADWIKSWDECLAKSITIEDAEAGLNRTQAGRASTSNNAP